MTDSYSLLNRDLRFYIHEKGWPALTKIQNASIKAFYTTNNNLILSAPTASGKTEACFLPAISKVSSWDKGIKILYISPLIALINDQFKRISDMCLDMDIPITSWHGEASQSKKEKIIANPRGIVLITPESIEAMLVNKPELAKTFFLDVEYIIVDEIHSFLFGNRGLQLKSLLERILRYTYNIPRMIGLSATIGEENYNLAKEFFNNGLDTNILVDKSRNDLDFTIDYFNTEKVSEDVVSKLRDYALTGPMLIFPNSRDKVETIAVKLNQLFKEKGEDIKVFAHHSSVSKQKRSEIENFAKEAKKEKFAICATSTLELGIDIGAVTSVSQYGSAHNVLTLAQRLGRSGRISKTSILHQISTNPWELLEALATIKLYQDSILDPIEKTTKAYDVFAHQILSSLLENYGIDIDKYKYLNKTLTSFSDITDEEFEKISDFMQKESYIEIIENQVIAGTAIEKLMTKGNFYNQFVLSGVYNVYNDKGKIGELEIRPEVQVDSNIYLAGSIWRITQILYKNKKILVEKANAGKAPKFSGIGDMDVSKLVRNKMKEILKNPDKIFDNDEINEVIDNLKEEFSDDDYLFVAGKDTVSLRTFQSSKVNRTLTIMLNIASNSKKFINDEVDSSIKGPDIIRYFDEIRIKKIEKKDIFKFFKENELFLQTYLNANKYMVLVPDDLKIDYIIRNRLDLEACYKYLAIDN